MMEAEMAQSVTIDAKSSNGWKYQINFAKTDKDKGSITLKPYGGKASSYDLYDVRALEANSIRCKADVIGFDPTVTCSVRQDQQKYSVRVDVTLLG
jgi:hypothetical protein